MRIDIENRYQVVEPDHGRGGFGKISKQYDTFLERLVAVKTLHLIADEELKERFIREARTLAKMSHPYIPSIYDVKFTEKDDEMIIYFEFIEGDNLRQLFHHGTIPSVQQAVLWFEKVASALEHASSLGIIHRDIKPENIIISQNAAYLVDFGIAIKTDDLKRITDPAYVVGTRDYMSPEQKEGRELDQTSDIYSLGLTLYETLAGRLPLAGQRYEPLSDSNEAIPPGLDDLIKACLIPEKHLRLASAGDFAKGLQSAFRTDIPLSKVLTEGRLHEVQIALQNMSPEEFYNKPKGQKVLVIKKARQCAAVCVNGLRLFKRHPPLEHYRESIHR